jgi:hypothetical protein
MADLPNCRSILSWPYLAAVAAAIPPWAVAGSPHEPSEGGDAWRDGDTRRLLAFWFKKIKWL